MIVVVEDGRIEESGTHEELIRKPGSIYRKLYEMQTF
jgi:ABC-type multidrug transport system fused ATPase/permease subunit